MKHQFLTSIAAIALIAGAAGAHAATATATFDVKITITSSCAFSAATMADIDLGTHSADAAVGKTGSTELKLKCSNKTPYNIALQSTNNASTAGLGTLKSLTAGNVDTLTYKLSSDAAGNTPWGNNNVSPTSTGNGVAGTGSGIEQTIPVHATVTATSPELVQADDYKDTVTATIHY